MKENDSRIDELLLKFSMKNIESKNIMITIVSKFLLQKKIVSNLLFRLYRPANRMEKKCVLFKHTLLLRQART